MCVSIKRMMWKYKEIRLLDKHQYLYDTCVWIDASCRDFQMKQVKTLLLSISKKKKNLLIFLSHHKKLFFCKKKRESKGAIYDDRSARSILNFFVCFVSKVETLNRENKSRIELRWEQGFFNNKKEPSLQFLRNS